MQRVLVIGSPGAGKSTFSRRLQSVTHLPLYHLDTIWHNPDKTNITKEEFDQQLQGILQKDQWILDGNFSRTLAMRLEYCDTVFLLDVPVEVCLSNVEARVGKWRDDLPWLEEEFDPEFRQYILDFPRERLPEIYELLSTCSDKTLYIFKSRKEMDAYFASIQ